MCEEYESKRMEEEEEEEEDEMEIRFEIMMEPHVCWEIKSIHNQYL